MSLANWTIVVDFWTGLAAPDADRVQKKKNKLKTRPQLRRIWSDLTMTSKTLVHQAIHKADITPNKRF